MVSLIVPLIAGPSGWHGRERERLLNVVIATRSEQTLQRFDCLIKLA